MMPYYYLNNTQAEIPRNAQEYYVVNLLRLLVVFPSAQATKLDVAQSLSFLTSEQTFCSSCLAFEIGGKDW